MFKFAKAVMLVKVVKVMRMMILLVKPEIVAHTIPSLEGPAAV
jgi:hypothetical protein